MGARPLIMLAAALAACPGPQPSAWVVAVGPSPEPGRERVLLAVRNDGRHGEVSLEVTLRGARGNIVRETRHVEMQGDERLSLTVDVEVPPDDYTATVSTKYPD
jgi:hypothetical protein